MPHSPHSPPAIPSLVVQAHSRVLAVAIRLIVQVHAFLRAMVKGRCQQAGQPTGWVLQLLQTFMMGCEAISSGVTGWSMVMKVGTPLRQPRDDATSGSLHSGSQVRACDQALLESAVSAANVPQAVASESWAARPVPWVATQGHATLSGAPALPKATGHCGSTWSEAACWAPLWRTRAPYQLSWHPAAAPPRPGGQLVSAPADFCWNGNEEVSPCQLALEPLGTAIAAGQLVEGMRGVFGYLQAPRSRLRGRPAGAGGNHAC